MRIAVLGGGPAGLYFSILMRKIRPDCEVTLYERRAPADVFGFGVVFSDETLTVFEHADPETYSQIAERFTRWSDIDIHHRGAKTTSGGHGFSAIGRRELLRILQERAASLGADLRFETEAPPVSELGWADLIVGADGASSAVRTAMAREFVPALDRRHCRYIWLGTDLVFDAFKFFIAETEHGVVQAHAYPYDDGMSTFIVEMHERTWKRLGLGERSIDDAVAWCSEVFADALDGHRLYSNNSRWINFVTVSNRRWCVGQRRAARGRGTHRALLDRLGDEARDGGRGGAGWAFRRRRRRVRGHERVRVERRPIVERTQRAAQASLEWFEGIGRYVEQERAPVRVQPAHAQPARHLRQPPAPRPGVRAVRSHPRSAARRCSRRLRLRGLELRQPRRGLADGHVLGDRRDAGRLPPRAPRRRARSAAPVCVMTEMICVSTIGRITPGCAGMYRDEHVAAWRRIVTFAHAARRLRESAPRSATPGARARRSSCGRGSTSRCRRGNWEVIAPRRSPYCAAQPGAARDDAGRHGRGPRPVRVAAAERALRGGLRPARDPHGARLPAVVVPLAARRTCATTSTAGDLTGARASRSRCSTPAARCGRRTSR